MNEPQIETNVLDEQHWRTWKAMGKRREQALARKYRLIGGTIVAIIVTGAAVYGF
jgi:hypothetical protein